MEAIKEDSQQIDYEAKMLQTLTIHVTERHSIPAADAQDTAERNALIEAHQLHARNLIDFFIPGVVREDDILVSHFLKSSWIPSGPEADRLRDLKTELHKRLAHLSRHRNVDFNGWRTLLITGDLMALVRQFIFVFRQENPQLQDWFSDTATALQYFDEDFGVLYISDVRTLRLER